MECSLHHAHPTQLAIIHFNTYSADVMMDSQEMKRIVMVIKLSLPYCLHIFNRKDLFHQG